MTFDLKKDPWYIRVNSFEESIAVQKWLFEQGLYGRRLHQTLHSV